MKRVLLFALPLTLLIFSCGKDKPCPDPRVYYHSIASDICAQFPFTGYDTLVFIRNGQKQYRYYGTGMDSGYNERDVGMECIQEVHYSQFKYIHYYSPDTSRSLNLSIVDSDGADEIHVDFIDDIFGTCYPYYADSMTIQGKTYYQISKWADVYLSKSYVLYTAKEGPIKIVSQLTGDVWERVR